MAGRTVAAILLLQLARAAEVQVGCSTDTCQDEENFAMLQIHKADAFAHDAPAEDQAPTPEASAAPTEVQAPVAPTSGASAAPTEGQAAPTEGQASVVPMLGASAPPTEVQAPMVGAASEGQAVVRMLGAAAPTECTHSRTCGGAGFRCFEKNEWYAACRKSCTPGIDMNDQPQFRTPWSCKDITMDSAPVVTECTWTKTCTIPGERCYQKDQYYAACKKSCTPGIDMNDPLQYRTPWSCKDITARPAPVTVTECTWTKTCTIPGERCYQKDQYYAACKKSCMPGIDMNDEPQYRTPWSCKILSR